MRYRRIFFYALIISGAIHIVGIGALGGFFNFPDRHSIPKTQIIDIDKEKSPLLPEIKVMGEIKKIIPQEENQETSMEKDKSALNAQAIEQKENIKTKDNKAEKAMLRYQDMIKQRIETFRKYPLQAKRAQTQGVVDLKFSVFANGATGEVQVMGSSGSKLLDNEALDTIKRASPFLPIPEEISQNMITIHVAIIFSLN